MGEVAVAAVVGAVQRMGLRVAPEKTEALVFCGASANSLPPPHSSILVSGSAVQVSPHIKYLGLILDSKWKFGEHFAQLAPRLGKISAALGRLMPNLGGPSGRVRRLYATTVQSVAMYGAPIFAGDLAHCHRATTATLRRTMRGVAIRVARCYRTV
ncbi:uncharacterized protein [Cardiocondyla obscurior]|uniref:uncharacterized protein n=1 Tax=Cardiocondyla obscurior TaxID=286306 RepID=UPI00396577A1